jgi:PEGA domain-containing protein
MAVVVLLSIWTPGVSAAQDKPAEPAPPAPTPAPAPPPREPAKKPPKPDAKAVQEARERYERGKVLYGEGEYQQALIEFERAYSLAPAYRVLFNIGQAAVMAQQYPKAIRAFKGYLEEGGKGIAPARRQQAEKELQGLWERVATLRVTADVDGAQILIDDESVGTTPLAEGITVNAGRHVVVARMAGRTEDRDVVTLAGKDDVELKMQLPELPKTQPIILPPTEPGQPVVMLQPGPRPVTRPEGVPYLWVGWLTTGTLTAGAVAVGIAALSNTGKLADLRDTPGVTHEELDDQQKTARALGIAADVLIASAGIAGAVTIGFTIKSAVDTSGDGGDVGLSVGPDGAYLRGSF